MDRDETLTSHRLDARRAGVEFKTTNLIESVMTRLEANTEPVDRLRTSDQKIRWCATTLGIVEAPFRRIRRYQEWLLLVHSL